MQEQVELGWQACFGRCRQGPNVLVRIAPPQPVRTLLATPPSGPGQNAALYNGVREEDVVKILQSHVARGIIVRELVLKPDAVLHPAASKGAEAPGTPSQPPTSTTNATNDRESGGEPK